MKKLLAITLLIVGLAITSIAQQAPLPQKQNKKEVKKKMKDELNLSKEQAKQLKRINVEFKDKARTIKENNSLTREQKKVQLKTLHKERIAKVNTILTPEQQQKFNEIKRAAHNKKSSPTTGISS